jgi:hypothetical protein
MSVVVVSDEDYTCNRSCTLDWISTLLTWSVVVVPDEGYTVRVLRSKSRVDSQSSVHDLLQV